MIQYKVSANATAHERQLVRQPIHEKTFFEWKDDIWQLVQDTWHQESSGGLIHHALFSYTGLDLREEASGTAFDHFAISLEASLSSKLDRINVR